MAIMLLITSPMDVDTSTQYKEICEHYYRLTNTTWILTYVSRTVVYISI